MYIEQSGLGRAVGSHMFVCCISEAFVGVCT